MTLMEVLGVVAPGFYFAGGLGLTSGVVALVGKRIGGNPKVYLAARLLASLSIFMIVIVLLSMLGIWGFAPLEKELFGR
jgi:Na+-driven multidrug efflux pump